MKESVYRTRGDRVNKTNMHEKNTDLPTTMFENSVMKAGWGRDNEIWDFELYTYI